MDDANDNNASAAIDFEVAHFVNHGYDSTRVTETGIERSTAGVDARGKTGAPLALAAQHDLAGRLQRQRIDE